jgi:transcription elongation factor GreA
MSLEASLQAYFKSCRPEALSPEPGFEALVDLARDEGRFGFLLERLSQARAWRELGMAAKAALAAEPGLLAARAYMRAHDEGAAPDLSREELIGLVDIVPDDPRALWLLAERLAAPPADDEESLRLTARSLSLFAREGRFEHLEEGLLRLLDANEAGPLRTALAVCVSAARAGEMESVLGFFDLAVAKMSEQGLAWDALAAVRRIAGKSEAPETTRSATAAFVRAAIGGMPSSAEILSLSGIESKRVPVGEALQRLDLLLRFLPGSFVEHSGWGVGRVKGSDLESVTVAFGAVGEKMMRHDLAAKSLVPLAGDDLRVLLSTDRVRVREMASKDPAGLLFLAIRRLGGEASGADIRRALEGTVVAAADWAAWWKTARDAARADARVDTGEAFRQVYRLADPGAAEAAVPRVEAGTPAAQAVGLLRRFLEHNPESAAAVRARYAESLERWLRDPRARAQDRGATLLLLLEWEPEREADLLPSLLAALGEGFDVSGLTTPAEQVRVVEMGARLPLDAREALLATALGSRYPEVRDHAFADVMSCGSDVGRFVRDLFAAGTERPAVLFALAAHYLEADEGAVPYGPWEVVRGLVRLLEERPADALGQRALRLLSRDGDLVARAAAVAAPADLRAPLQSAVVDWKGSDRYLFPIVDFLEAAGLAEEVEAFRSRRAAMAERLAERAEAAAAAAPSGTWMTRASFEALREEIRRVGLALKTTIPEAIRKARELGDLRENAEYAAARAKQMDFARRLADLETQAAVVRVIEDQKISGDIVAPGTEVEIVREGDGTAHLYWILGEGDQRHGPNVVSCMAPLGKALLGKRVGESAAIGEGPERFEIRSIRVRLPGTD